MKTRGVRIAAFTALAAFTAITVGISYMRVNFVLALTLALLVATIKGTLVACYFMHLLSERKLIYAVLLMTAGFFLVLLFLPLGSVMGSTGG